MRGCASSPLDDWAKELLARLWRSGGGALAAYDPAASRPKHSASSATRISESRPRERAIDDDGAFIMA